MGSMADDDRLRIDDTAIELNQWNDQPTHSLYDNVYSVDYIDQCTLRLHLLNRKTNSTKYDRSTSSCELITPIYYGGYMCSVEQLLHSPRNLIEDLEIEHLIMIYYDCHPHNRRPLAALIEDSGRPNHLKRSLSTIIRHLVRIPPENNDNDDDAGPLGQQCYDCLMKLDAIMTQLSRRYRFLITYVHEQSDLVIAFTSYSLSKCMSMSIAATYNHIRNRLNIIADSSQPSYSHMSDYRDQTAMIHRFLRLMHSIQTDFELNKTSHYHSFLEFVRHNKFDQLEPIGSCTTHNGRQLATLLRQYHNYYARSNNDDPVLAKLESSYICQRCSYELFTDSNILRPPSLSIMAMNYGCSNKYRNGQYCPSIFIEPMEWMFRSNNKQFLSLHRRTIYCPQCRTVVGHFRLNGMNCRHKIAMGVCSQHPDKKARIFQIHLRMIYIRSSPYLPLILYRIWCHSRARQRLKSESKSIWPRLFNLPSLSSTLAYKRQQQQQQRIQKYRLQNEQTMASDNDKDNQFKSFIRLSIIRQAMINQISRQNNSNNSCNESNRPLISQPIRDERQTNQILKQNNIDSDVVNTLTTITLMGNNKTIEKTEVTTPIINNIGVRTRSNRQTDNNEQLKLILTGEHSNNRLQSPEPARRSPLNKFAHTGQNPPFSPVKSIPNSVYNKSTHENSNGLRHSKDNEKKIEKQPPPSPLPPPQSTISKSPLHSLTSPIDSSDSSMSLDDDDDDGFEDDKQAPPTSRTTSTKPKPLLLSISNKANKPGKSNEVMKCMDCKSKSNTDAVIARKSIKVKNRSTKQLTTTLSTNINGHHHTNSQDLDDRNEDKIRKMMLTMMKPESRKTTSTYKIPKKKPETPPSPPSRMSTLKSSSPSSVRRSRQSFASHTNNDDRYNQTMKNGTLIPSQSHSNSSIVMNRNYNHHQKGVDVRLNDGGGGGGGRRRCHQSSSPASRSSSLTRSSTIDINKRRKLMRTSATIDGEKNQRQLNGPSKIHNHSGRITSSTLSSHHSNRDR